MNLTTPLLKGIIRGTELRGDSVTSLLQKVDRNTGLFAGDDGGLGMVMSGLAGVAAALAVAILLSPDDRLRQAIQYSRGASD
jgi:hypothetical protein